MPAGWGVRPTANRFAGRGGRTRMSQITETITVAGAHLAERTVERSKAERFDSVRSPVEGG